MLNIIKIIVEILPLVAFFSAFKFYGIIIATYWLIGMTIFAVLLGYIVEKKISKMQISTLVIITIMGAITIFSGDSQYIKMKPTIINIIFSLILILSIINKKLYIKFIFQNQISMPEESWIVLTKRMAWFFLFCAILNEIVWRNFSESIWVNFKVFAILPLTFLFITLQFMLLKNQIVIKS